MSVSQAFLSSTSFECGSTKSNLLPKIACNLAFQYSIVVVGNMERPFSLSFMHKTKRRKSQEGWNTLYYFLFDLQKHQKCHFECLHLPTFYPFRFAKKRPRTAFDNCSTYNFCSTTYVKHPRRNTVPNKNGLVFVNHLKMTSCF